MNPPSKNSNPLYPSIDQYQSQSSFHPPTQPTSMQYYNNNVNAPNYVNPQSGYAGNVPNQSQPPNQFGEGFISSMSDAAFSNMGSHMFNTAGQYVDKNFGKFLTLRPLKYYFNVNNSYVLNKIKVLLCPLMHKQWKRRIERHNDVEAFVPPREDINAPDLYIPVMAFVTYVLIVGFTLGTASKFTPETLGMTSSTGLVTLTLEVLLVKAGFYLLNCGNIPICDLLAYCGYKFVGIVVEILSGIFFGPLVYTIFSVYMGISMGIFLVRTFRLVLNFEATVLTDPRQSSMTKKYFLLIVALLQLLLVYFLGVKT